MFIQIRMWTKELSIDVNVDSSTPLTTMITSDLITKSSNNK